MGFIWTCPLYSTQASLKPWAYCYCDLCYINSIEQKSRYKVTATALTLEDLLGISTSRRAAKLLIQRENPAVCSLSTAIFSHNTLSYYSDFVLKTWQVADHWVSDPTLLKIYLQFCENERSVIQSLAPLVHGCPLSRWWTSNSLTHLCECVERMSTFKV